MGRKSLYENSEDKVKAQQDYQKEYYNRNKVKKLKLTVIENAINRIEQDDTFIKMFLDKIGSEKIQELMNQ